MTFEEVKDAVFDVVASFFADTAVIWAEQTATRPQLPYITLKTDGITRDTFPSVSEDGDVYYNASTRLDINLYTQGRKISGSGLENYVNTATSDMNDFFQYLDSDQGLDLLEEKGLSIMLTPPIQDLTALENDATYRFRTMAEATVSFVDEANGAYGLYGHLLPNPSLGGSDIMSSTEMETIETVETKEVE